jgi:hypothetical protein
MPARAELQGNFMDADKVKPEATLAEAKAAIAPVREARRRRQLEAMFSALLSPVRRRSSNNRVAPAPPPGGGASSQPDGASRDARSEFSGGGPRALDSVATSGGTKFVDSAVSGVARGLQGNSLGIFGPHNRFRHAVARFLTYTRSRKPRATPLFDNAILLCIITSSVCLALDGPKVDPAGTLAAVLGWFDIVLTAVFTAEMALKLVARGLIAGDDAYLKNGWNVLDGTIVLLSILSLATSGSSLRAFKSFRTLRVMRPLRLISRNEGMRLVVNAFFKAIPAIANVIFVTVLVFLLFAVVGVSFFKGSFNSCQGTNATYLSPDQQALLQTPIPYSMLTPAQQAWGAPGGYEGVTSKSVCEWLYCVWWPVIPQSFNNIGSAFLSLFSSCTVRAMPPARVHASWRACSRRPRRGHSLKAGMTSWTRQ